ncbi:GIY-YIG nuclease family protein [Oscillospiraceae bacterium PP1C4]
MDSHKKELINAYKQRPLTGGVCIIKNTENGKYLLEVKTNPQGSKSRFDFSQATNSCAHFKLKKDWDTFGKDAFVFEILDEIEQKETQTPEEFQSDLAVLGELWSVKFDPALAY